MAAVSEQRQISTKIFLFFSILSLSTNVHGWDSIDLELFDLVEEIKDNFYDVLGLKQVSLTKSVRMRFEKMFNNIACDLLLLQFTTLIHAEAIQ